MGVKGLRQKESIIADEEWAENSITINLKLKEYEIV